MIIMNNTEEKIEMLYKDAMYYHLIRNGYTTKQARRIVEKNF